MAEVLHTIDTECYHPIEKNRAMIKALDAYVREADPHCQFLGPDEYKELLAATSGSYCGIGVELQRKNERDALLIQKITPGSPAEKAGLQKNDAIISIDGANVSALSTQEALKKLKGDKQHFPVKLSIMRGKKLMNFTIRRDLIHQENCICYYLPNQQVIYCKIALFTQQIAAQVTTLLERALQREAKRPNSGFKR